MNKKNQRELQITALVVIYDSILIIVYRSDKTAARKVLGQSIKTARVDAFSAYSVRSTKPKKWQQKQKYSNRRQCGSCQGPSC
jgi:hypothetical protein